MAGPATDPSSRLSPEHHLPARGRRRGGKVNPGFEPAVMVVRGGSPPGYGSGGLLPAWRSCEALSSEVASAATPKTTASIGCPATARAAVPAPNRTSSIATRVGIGTSHLAFGATHT